MPLLLIVEDSSAEVRKAADTALRAGFTDFEVTSYASDARNYIEKALEGKGILPDAMLVDLDLGIESGFELLRFWHKEQRLKTIPVVVWTVMGEQQREICSLFGVTHFVSKEEGPQALMKALTSIITGGEPTTAQRLA